MKSFKIGDITIPVPIVQGGMGIGISLSGLASAVASAGGIGTIAAVGVGILKGSSDKNYRQNNREGLINEIRKARKKTQGVLAVNIMTVLSNFSELVESAIKEKIDVIFSGAGLPLDLPKYKTKDSNTKLVPIVSSARAAKIITNKWFQNYNYLPDAFVVEGPKAGGHLGYSFKDLESEEITLEELIQDVVKVADEIYETHQKRIPIIAGGGITTGQEIKEILKLGASAVQMGSIFIATEECDASPEFKEAIISCKKEDIQIIKSPVGLPGRALKNNFVEEAKQGIRQPKSCKYNCIKTCNPKTTEYCITDALVAAYKGNLTDGFVFTGANAYKINAISTVKEVFKKLKDEYSK